MNPFEAPSVRLSRRRFVKTAATVSAATIVQTSLSQKEETGPTALIDTNVSLGQWPFRQEALADTAALVARLRGQGVTQAWAGSFDALLHKDISSVNTRLAAECKEHGPDFLAPIGALNPMLPGWEQDLHRCVDDHQMAGIRLHPNYHGYPLGDSLFERVLQLANDRNLFVQISVIMEDERTIHPLVNVPATDTAPLPVALTKFPNVRLQLLNAFRTLRGLPVISLAAHGVSFEIAMLEGVSGISNLLEKLPADRLCFGSHAPLFYFESAKLKLQESILTEPQLNALRSSNALRLISRA
ncbi:MAG TPA: amidohydrolase family protein [Verrucomicrobiales bacterium]|nr:amidohydrolase family protein [Verrucomicrobiales bacterium]